MYTELFVYEAINTVSIKSLLFQAIKKKLYGITIPPAYLGSLRDLIPAHFNVSTILDYPHGLGEPKVRHHSILSAIRKKTKTIDLTANHLLLADDYPIAFFEDVQTCQTICKSNGVDLRIILDIHTFSEAQILLAVDMIRTADVEYIILGNSFHANLADTLLLAREIATKFDVKLLVNTALKNKNELAAVQNSSFLYGIRIPEFGLLGQVFNSSGVL